MTSVAFASVSTTSTRRELDDDDGSQRRRRFGRRTGRRATRVASASDASASSSSGSDVIRALLDRALEDGTRAREDVIDVGARERDGARVPGVVARRDVEAGTTLVTRSVASTAFDATYARECASNALTRAIEEYEGTVEREMSDDVVVALALAAARREPESASPLLGAYAASLPTDAVSTPALYEDEAFEALVPLLSLHFIDRVDAARREFALAYDDARQTYALARGGDVLEEHEFAWAWSMVRSRAITFEVKKASTGRIERKRCLVPVCDVFNHSPTSLSGDGDAEDGPNVRIETNDAGESMWTATRDVKQGDALRWTYGELSNEEMWLWYGFVPENPLHGDSSVAFNLPDAVFANGLNAVAKEDSEETGALRRRLLERAGALGLNEGEELSFVVSARAKPAVLGGIAGVMCCDAEEVVSIAAAATVASKGVDERALLFELKPESRRRAGRYVAWLLTQVEAFVCGATDEEVAESERVAESVGGVFAERFATAKRIRLGAQGTFATAQKSLTDEELLRDGAWIDGAVDMLVVR